MVRIYHGAYHQLKPKNGPHHNLLFRGLRALKLAIFIVYAISSDNPENKEHYYQVNDEKDAEEGADSVRLEDSDWIEGVVEHYEQN
jgi:hypothetical protein